MCTGFEYTEKVRMRLCKVLVALEVVNILMAKTLTYHGFRYRKRLALYTSLVEGYDGGVLPIMLCVTGILVVLMNLFGLYTTFRCMFPSIRYRVVPRARLYVRLVIFVSFFVVSCIVLSTLQESTIQGTFKHGIMSALRRYRTDPKIKEDIDKLQMYFGCCGNEKYTDWFQINWINEAYVDVNLPEEQRQIRRGQYETDDVPFSCCNTKAKRPCITRHVHDNVRNFNYVYQKDLTIFKDGCRTVLINMADRLVLFVFGVCVLILFDSICIVVFLRTLIDSIALALEQDDPTASVRAPAPKGFGWMFDTVGQELRAKTDPKSSPMGGGGPWPPGPGPPSSAAPATTFVRGGGTTDYSMSQRSSYYGGTPVGSLRPPLMDRRLSIAPASYPPNVGNIPRPSYRAGMPNPGLPAGPPGTPYQKYPPTPAK